MKKVLLFIFLGMAGVLFSTISGSDRTYNILFICSYAPSTPFQGTLTKGLQQGLNGEGLKANVTVEYLNAEYWSYASECVIMRRICDRARQRRTDLIVTAGDEAFYDLITCGDSLGYELPVVVTGIKYPNEKLMKDLPNVTGFTAKTDFKKLFAEMKRIFPGRKEVICLSDSSSLSHRGIKALEEAWPEFQRENPEYTLLKKNVQSYPTADVISSICYSYNAYNRVVVVPKWNSLLSFISKNSKAPVFTGQALSLTNGVLCAYDVVYKETSYAAGQLAAWILRGKTTPASSGIVNLNGTFQYDYKQLEFFRVDTDVVDGHGIIMNAPFREHYSELIIISYSVVLIVLMVLLALVFRLWRTKRKEARRNLQVQTRLLMQARLVEQRDEYDDIFSSIRDGLVSYDVDLRIHFINRSLMRMLGIPLEKYESRFYEGQVACSIFHIYLDGKNILLSLLKQVLEEQKTIPIPTNTFVRENEKGFYFPVSGEVLPVFAKGGINGVALLCRNISEEERQKQLFNMAMEESAVYPWQFDMNTRRFNFSESLLLRLGYSNVQNLLTRKELNDYIHPDDKETARSSFEELLQNKCTNLRRSYRVRTANGKYEWWEYRSVSYKGLTPDTPYMVLGVAQSIQHYKDTEVALIAARDQALQSDRLKSAFLANMSHEIRTPLNAIVGFSDLLRDLDTFSAEEVRDFVELINTNCSLLLALINDILDLSRIEAGTMEFNFSRYNLSTIMQEVYNSQRMGLRQGVELRIECPAGEGQFIQTDIVRLKQVVNNLINNSKKFTVSGSITLGYTVDRSGCITIFVEDTGKGIPQEDIERIFDRFYKVDTFAQGAGLGLSICQTIVESLCGVISVTSEVGKGTRFEVMLSDKT